MHIELVMLINLRKKNVLSVNIIKLGFYQNGIEWKQKIIPIETSKIESGKGIVILF